VYEGPLDAAAGDGLAESHETDARSLDAGGRSSPGRRRIASRESEPLEKESLSSARCARQ